jgi:DNA-binding transcriptional ArsR family regulator
MCRSYGRGRPPGWRRLALTNWTARSFTCKVQLTGERKRTTLTSEELLAELNAIAHPLRLRIIAELARGRLHVSELARRLGMSRPLLYMHLDRLEKAGLVSGQLELSDDGKAMKYFELVPFELRVTAETVISVLAADQEQGKQSQDNQEALEMEQIKDE